jgi:hypothetical protein
MLLLEDVQRAFREVYAVHSDLRFKYMEEYLPLFLEGLDSEDRNTFNDGWGTPYLENPASYGYEESARDYAIQGMVALGPAVLPSLQKYLTNEARCETCVAALEVVCRLGNYAHEHLDNIVYLLNNSPFQSVKNKAGCALGSMPKEIASSSISAALSNPDEGIIQGGILAWKEQKKRNKDNSNKQEVETLLVLMEHSHPAVRKMVLSSFSCVQGFEAERQQMVLIALDDEIDEVWKAGLLYLSNHYTSAPISIPFFEALVLLCKNKNPHSSQIYFRLRRWCQNAKPAPKKKERKQLELMLAEIL